MNLANVSNCIMLHIRCIKKDHYTNLLKLNYTVVKEYTFEFNFLLTYCHYNLYQTLLKL